LHGTQGPGKTTAAEFLRDLIDMSSIPTLSLSKDETEFVQMADHHCLINLDNVQKLPQWASDAYGWQ